MGTVPFCILNVEFSPTWPLEIIGMDASRSLINGRDRTTTKSTSVSTVKRANNLTGLLQTYEGSFIPLHH